MAGHKDRRIRTTKQALATRAARPPTERALAASTPDGPRRNPSTAALVPTSGAAIAQQLAPSGQTSQYGGMVQVDPSKEAGTPGNLNMFGFLTGEDYNPDLDGLPMFANYNKMRLSDAQVNATLLMLKLPLKGATWIAKPASDDPQDVAIADFVQANVIDDDALARTWQHVLDNALLKFDFGCSAEEIVWDVKAEGPSLSRRGEIFNLIKYGDTWALDRAIKQASGDATVYAGLKDLAPRLPRTFYRWVEDAKTGQLDYLQQFAPKNGQYGYWNIQARRLVLHVRNREGNNYWGRSVLRTAYPHWWWKQQLYRIDMIGHDRFHVGIPRAKLLDTYNAAKAPIDKIEATLKGLRTHDRAYMVQPAGVEYDIYAAPGASHGTSGIIQSIEHHNLMIARNILQSFAAQGEQRHGSFGAATVTVDVYYDALEGEAREIASEIKQGVVRQLCDLNFNMDGRKYPDIVCTDLRTSDFTQLSTAFSQLAAQALVTPDDGLEQFFRDLADAPQLPEDLKGQDRTARLKPPAPTSSFQPAEPTPTLTEPKDGKTPPKQPVKASSVLVDIRDRIDATLSPLDQRIAQIRADVGLDKLTEMQVEQERQFSRVSAFQQLLQQSMATDLAELQRSTEDRARALEELLTTRFEGFASRIEEIQRLVTTNGITEEGIADQLREIANERLRHQDVVRQIRSAREERESRESFVEEGRGFSRKPTTLERQMFEFHKVPARLDQEHARLVRELATLRHQQLETFAGRLAKKDARPTTPFTDLRKRHIGSMPLVVEMKRAIREAQDRVEDFGARSVVTELRKQGAQISAAGEKSTAGQNQRSATSALVTGAEATARKLTDSWAYRILETANRLRRSGTQGDDLRTAVVAALTDEAESGAKRDAAAKVNEAYAIGREGEATRQQDSIEKVIYSALLDENTCFWPGTLITTARGAVPVEQLEPSDSVLSDRGRYVSIYGVYRLPGKASVSITVGERRLCVTVDHPILVRRAGVVRWLEAGSVRSGDTVFTQSLVQPSAEIGPDDATFWNPNRCESQSLGVPRLAPVAVPHSCGPMPIGTVDVNHQMERRNVKIPKVAGPEVVFATHAHAELSQRAMHGELNRARSAKASVAAKRAESRLCAWANPETSVASIALSVNGRSSAGFGTEVLATRAAAADEELAPAPTTCTSNRLRTAAGGRADAVPVNVRGWNAKCAATPQAHLRDPIGSASIRAEAPLSAAGCTELEFSTAPSAGQRRMLAGSPPFDRAAAPAAVALRGPGPSNPAVHTGESAWQSHVVDAVEVLSAPAVVFDVALTHDHTLFAEGILVHNCGACEAWDGKEMQVGDADYYASLPPNKDCEGNKGTPDACRCVHLFVFGE